MTALTFLGRRARIAADLETRASFALACVRVAG